MLANTLIDKRTVHNATFTVNGFNVLLPMVGENQRERDEVEREVDNS